MRSQLRTLSETWEEDEWLTFATQTALIVRGHNARGGDSSEFRTMIASNFVRKVLDMKKLKAGAAVKNRRQTLRKRSGTLMKLLLNMVEHSGGGRPDVATMLNGMVTQLACADIGEDDCSAYSADVSLCGGTYDTSAFSSSEMCCACGGGGSRAQQQTAVYTEAAELMYRQMMLVRAT